MVTLVKDPFFGNQTDQGSYLSSGQSGNNEPQTGYNGYVEPDTKIPPQAKPILAEVSVNGVTIEESRIMAEAQQHPADNPGQALMSAAKALVVRELLLQEAQSLNLAAVPESNGDGGIETDEDALIRQLMEKEIETPISDETVRKRYYELNRHRFKSETIHEARHILIAVTEKDAEDKKRAEAQAILDTLLSGHRAFAKFAKEVSDCPSKMEGGNLGQLTTGSTVPEFESVLEKMESGQIWPELVQTRFGFHIVELVNTIPGEVLPFEYVEEKIGAWLEASSWSRAVAQYISILASNAQITGVEMEAAASPLVQ